MPSAMKPNGIHSFGPQTELLARPSAHASPKSSHDFHAMNTQNASESRSASARRTRLARAGSTPSSTSIDTWPRWSWVYAALMNVAMIRSITANSISQSVAQRNQ